MPSPVTNSPPQQPSPFPDMATDPTPSRRSRPNHVQTNLGPVLHAIAVPESAISSSPSISPSSQHGSPSLGLDPSICGLAPAVPPRDSSDDLLPLEKAVDDLDISSITFSALDPTPTPPIATLSRRTSTTSLAPGALKSPGTTSAMGEAMRSITNLSRRSSNSFRRVHSLVANRRPSSSHPRSRDGSVGPGLMRRRGSTSNPSLPFEQTSPLFTDSEDDCAIEKDDCGSLFSVDGQSSTPASTIIGASTPGSMVPGPLIPPPLIQGTLVTKVGKKKNTKRITLFCDPQGIKIFWDRNRASKAIYVDDIREIRTGEDVGQYRLDSRLDESTGSRLFSILYNRQGQTATKTLHVLTEDEKQLSLWTDTLESLCKWRQAFATSLMCFDDKALKKWWLNETAKHFGDDRNRVLGEGKVDTLAVEHVCRSLHIHIPAQELRERVETAKGRKGGFDRLDFAEFQQFVRLLKVRKDVRSVYRQTTDDTERGITKDEFFWFLRDSQRENVDDDLAHWESVFASYARKGRPRDGDAAGEEVPTISEAAFTNFLTSTHNPAIVKEPQEYTLDRPMTEYYISSSHNTYLLGRQIYGVSSVEGYISALARGCRCIEIDCWDGPNDEPIVMHGHSFTTRISFLEVVKTINKYAFTKSRFPLWISLEVRCSLATQAKMAQIMIENFGDKLVREPLVKDADRIPTPSELLERILIKVKQSPPPEEQAKSITRRRGNSQPSPYQRPIVSDTVPVPSSPLLSPTQFSRSTRQVNTFNTITEGQVHDLPSNSPSECESDSEKDSTSRKIVGKINPVLGELGVYCRGIQFEGFEAPNAKTFNHIFSFKEKTFTEKCQPKEGKRMLCMHNMRYMMRVYPNGGRVNSSNFDPLLYWKRGVQMAALNWQTFDTGMQLNQAMFDGGTDQSGYVLKPVEGRGFELRPELSPSDCIGKRPRKSVKFTITVHSAQQLMRPFDFPDKRPMDPYVEVEVLRADDKRNKDDNNTSGTLQDTERRRTTIVRGNGFNPQFNDKFDFSFTTKYPDLIFVRFNVKLADKSYNDKATPIATFTAKLNSLRDGYRTIPLYNQYGDRFLVSALFCNIKKEKMADVMVDYTEEMPRNGRKLGSIKRTVFSSSSPKSSIESSRST
ncbi:hypothetical protein OQA88_13627 [Cercophora sp. LCS_1]